MKFPLRVTQIILCLIIICIFYFLWSPASFITKTNEKSTQLTQTIRNELNKTNIPLNKTVSQFNQQFMSNLIRFHKPPLPLNNNIKERIKNIKPFQMQITLSERNMMYIIMEKFDDFMKSQGIPYMIIDGTLLGSYRHHDFIPWDDDIDVFVNLNDRERLRDLCKLLEPKFKLHTAGNHDKFYQIGAQKTSTYPWSWPYVDVCFYKENSTHIWDIDNTYGEFWAYPKSIIFPFKRRPLFNLNLPAPRDTFATLVWRYGFTDLCVQFGYSHILEDSVGPHGKSRCKRLGNKYPFVKHYLTSGGLINEKLTFKGEVLTDYMVDEPSYAVAKTFSIRLKPGYTIPENVELPVAK